MPRKKKSDVIIPEADLTTSQEDLVAAVTEALGDEMAQDVEAYVAPDENWRPEITRTVRIRGKDVTERITIVPRREAIRMYADNFMSIQRFRIGLQNQIRSVSQGYDDRPAGEIELLQMQLEDAIISEENAKTVLEAITVNNPICRWMRENIGVGPILAAELYAYLDFTKVKYASGFVTYAGLNDNNRPKLSKEQAQRMVDEVIGDADGFDITDDMLMELAVKSKWSFEYLAKKAVKESKVKSLCRKSRLIQCVELLLDDKGETPNHAEVMAYINSVVTNPSATQENFQEVAAHYEIPYEKLFDIAVTTSTKNKLKTSGGARSKEQLRKAISVYPYNKTLKMIVYKLATSFVYQSTNEKCFYGKLYRQRLQYELEKNAAGDYADQAARIIGSKNFDKTTQAYKAYSQGFLPKSHITARAMRWTAKVFINHLYEAMWVYYHQDLEHPEYYAIAHMGHYDVIRPAIPYDMLLNKNLPKEQQNLNPMPKLPK